MLSAGRDALEVLGLAHQPVGDESRLSMDHAPAYEIHDDEVVPWACATAEPNRAALRVDLPAPRARRGRDKIGAERTRHEAISASNARMLTGQMLPAIWRMACAYTL